MNKAEVKKLIEKAENCDVEAMKSLIDYLNQPTVGAVTSANYKQGLTFFVERYYDEAIEDFSIAYDDSDLSILTRSKSAYYTGLCFENRRREDNDYHHAVEWYKKAAAFHYSAAAYRLGEIYETGINHFNEDTYDYSYEIICPISSISAKYYLRAAVLGNSDGMHKMSEMYSSGTVVVRNYEKSFHWSLLAACHDQKYCGDLCLKFLTGIGIDENPFEAYVWSVMARGDSGCPYCDDLEEELPKKEVLRAQREAEYRDKLFYYIDQDAFVLYDYMIETLKKAMPDDKESHGFTIGEKLPSLAGDGTTPDSVDESPVDKNKSNPALDAKLKNWKLTSLANLTFHIRPKGRSVHIVFGRKKASLSFNDFSRLFSPYALPLFVDHFKATISTEPPVDYFSCSLACSVNKKFSRPNNKVVSYVNSRMREIFGISAINEKAFVWITGSDPRQKSLKARIKIMVHYLD